jgi:ribonuclease-3
LTKSPGALAKSIGHDFQDLTLLQQALTHRSAGGANNERLEFLGDAVLGCVIAEELYRCFPRAREGELSRLRARLVRRDSLAAIAGKLAVGQYLNLGAGERRSGGHHRDSILADAVEAVFGAVYLDEGFEAARRCILTQFADSLAALPHVAELKDAKTRLQEYLQSRHLALPEYSVVKVSGQAHAQTFRVQCTVEGIDREPTQGQGSSRRQAEQEAAGNMLAQLDAG